MKTRKPITTRRAAELRLGIQLGRDFKAYVTDREGKLAITVFEIAMRSGNAVIAAFDRSRR